MGREAGSDLGRGGPHNGGPMAESGDAGDVFGVVRCSVVQSVGAGNLKPVIVFS